MERNRKNPGGALGVVDNHGLWAQATERGVIESPSAFVSGIGFISGWKCNTNDITLKMYCRGILHDLDPAQHMLRSDTREVCDGEIDNGWIIQVNWEDWAGCTRVDALDNGQQFASRKFAVGESRGGVHKRPRRERRSGCLAFRPQIK